MSNSSVDAAKNIVKELVNNFHYQLQVKEAVKKLPQHIHQQVTTQIDHTLLAAHLPKPSSKIDYSFKEDPMLIQPNCEIALTSCIPSLCRKDFDRLHASPKYTSKRNLSSRYASTAGIERVKLNLGQLSLGGLVKMPDPQLPGTAKSFRSVIELDNQINSMRSTYLRDSKEQARLKMSMTQELPNNKKKRVPRQFTFDVTGQIIERRPYNTKRTVFSPLKAKSITPQKIQNRVKRAPQNPNQDDNLQEILQRAATKSTQRKKRQFSNELARQVSHIPYISLTQNTKLIENSNVLKGPQSPRDCEYLNRSKMMSTFTQYYKNQQKNREDLISESEEQIRIPSTYRPRQARRSNHGSILKNSRLWAKEAKNEASTEFTDFKPVNVTRDHGIDKYYKLGRSNQFDKQ